VLGCGVDVIYPAEHRKLAEAIIAGGGALISELPIGTQPLAENFPTRNRILSGLCLGVVIVEAAEKSGSLITARMALEQDRQVFAVPGSPLTGKTRGSNRLLKEGAKLVECVEDVIEELAPQMIKRLPHEAAPTASVPLDTENVKFPPVVATPGVANDPDQAPDSTITILNYLTDTERLHIDSIIEATGLNAQTVLRLLLELELEGRITQHPGKLFSLA
jgi:DNA processing protein